MFFFAPRNPASIAPLLPAFRRLTIAAVVTTGFAVCSTNTYPLCAL